VFFRTLEGSGCAGVVAAPLKELSQRIGAFGGPTLVTPTICRLRPFEIASPFQCHAQIDSAAWIARFVGPPKGSLSASEISALNQKHVKVARADHMTPLISTTKGRLRTLRVSSAL